MTTFAFLKWSDFHERTKRLGSIRFDLSRKKIIIIRTKQISFRFFLKKNEIIIDRLAESSRKNKKKQFVVGLNFHFKIFFKNVWKALSAFWFDFSKTF